MKIINKINSVDILTIDIETVRLYEELKDAPEVMQSAWERKNTNEGVVPDFITLSNLWDLKAPLYAEFSKVCSISVSYLTKNGDLKVKSYYGEDELKMLQTLYSDLSKFYDYNRSYRILGHASKYFDIPFLCKRYIINGLDIPNCLDESNAKPWEMRNQDTNELWRSFGTGPGSSLEALCHILSVPTSKVDLVGDEVGEAYYNGEFLRIAEYCSKDVVSTFNVFRRFKKEPIFEFEDAEYVFENTDQLEHVETVEVLLVDVIQQSGTITKDQADKIIEQNKDETVENKQIVIDNIKAMLLYNNEDVDGISGFKYLCDNLIEVNSDDFVFEGDKFQKKDANSLIKEFKGSSKDIKLNVLEGVRKHILDNNHQSQKRVNSAYEHLQNEFNIEHKL